MVNSYFVNNINQNYFLIKINNNIFAVNNLKNTTYTTINKFITNKKNLVIYPISSNKILKINNNNTIYFNTNKKVINKNIILKKILWTFIKFKYHGKGYKIKKYNKLNKLTFRFGKSHWTKLLYDYNKIIIKRTKKNSYCVLSLDIKYNNYLGSLLKKIKGINQYTKRGVRLHRFKLHRRFGKVSQAASVYK